MAASLGPIGWEAICIAIGLLSLFIAALVHMFSTSFSMPQVTLWAKSEYAQVAVTFLIIAFAVAMAGAGNRVVGEVTDKVALASGNIDLKNAAASNLNDPFKIAKAYILQGPIRCEKNIYQAVYMINWRNEVWSSVTADFFGVEGASGQFALSGWVTLAHYINQTIVYLGVFHYIQYYLLVFSQYTMLQIFLPIGLILRAFPFSRGAGGFICSIALAFGFVFPISYVLIVAMMPDARFACTTIDAEAAGLTVQPCYQNYGEVMEAYYTAKANVGKDSGFFQMLQNGLGELYLQALFYPMAALIIAFTVMRQGSSLLGADLAEIGRGLIKII